MSIRLLLVLVLTLGVLPRAAAQDVPAEVDKILWCASAFYWLAGSAEDAGATEEAETYDRWSNQLLDGAGPDLVAAGVPPSRIEELVAQYDEKVLAQIGTADASYNIVTCPALVRDRR